MGRQKEKCPRCGYLLYPKSGKTVVRIWMETELEDIWSDFSKNFTTKSRAFKKLLELAGLLPEEKARAYVEVPEKR